MFTSLVSGTALGLMWAIMTLGVYITYRLLDFADLSVEGSIVTGAAVAVMIAKANVTPFVGIIVGFLAGAVAGALTGLMNTKLKIPPILSGILTMTGLYSINLAIMKSPNISYSGIKSMTSVIQGWINIPTYWINLIIAVVFCVLTVAFLYWFFGTQLGGAIRATGTNEKMCRAQGINTDNTKILGLMLSNGLVALGGVLISQQQGYVNVTMGVGSIVIGLAGVIIGEAIFRKSKSFLVTLISIIVGSVIYRLIITLITWANINADYLKLITAAMVAIALSIPLIQKKIVFAVKKSKNKKLEYAPSGTTVDGVVESADEAAIVDDNAVMSDDKAYTESVVNDEDKKGE